MARIAVIAGDGVGREVTAEAVKVLRALEESGGPALELVDWPHGADRYLETGETITDAEFADLEANYQAVLLGALGDPRVPGNEHARQILLGMRFRLDLYINFRPVQLLHPDLTPLRADRQTGGQPDSPTARRPQIDFVIFRENTEGVYLGRGRIEGDQYIAEEVNTAKGVE